MSSTMNRTKDAYEHFSKHEPVRITRSWRSAAGPEGDRFSAWDDHAAGITGEIVDMTNAGFRGLEYTVLTDEGWAHGISATDLEALDPGHPITPWPRQTTYRDGNPVNA